MFCRQRKKVKKLPKSTTRPQIPKVRAKTRRGRKCPKLSLRRKRSAPKISPISGQLSLPSRRPSKQTQRSCRLSPRLRRRWSRSRSNL